MLNDDSSAFGTVGCVSAPVTEEQGHRISGYVEFAFDSAEAISEAGSYFPIFFHFDKARYTLEFGDKVHYHWELLGAVFRHTDADGYTIRQSCRFCAAPALLGLH